MTVICPSWTVTSRLQESGQSSGHTVETTCSLPTAGDFMHRVYRSCADQARMATDLALLEPMSHVGRVRPSRSVSPHHHVESAKSAGLRYVSDAEPGIRRVMGPLGFRYVGAHGLPIRKEAELKRIRA